MTTKTFNRQVYMPTEIATLPVMTIAPVYSGHAIKASHTDRYGYMALPKFVSFSGADVVEATFEGEALVKLVIRIQYLDSNKDMILVIIPSTLIVKTVWWNLSSDQHKTLDVSKFATK